MLNEIGRPILTLAAAITVGLGFTFPAFGESAGAGITLETVPTQVCFTGRSPQYLNFDLLIKNGTKQRLDVKEVRATVLSGAEAVERRLIWAQSVELLAPHRTIEPGAAGTIFNPLIFNSLRAGRRVRFEVAFNGDVPPASLIATPTSCSSRAELILPIAGRVLVFDGYDVFSHHRRSDYTHPNWGKIGVFDNTARFGLDLAIVSSSGEMFRGNGARQEGWYGWRRPVRAPARGTVVATHDGQPDNTIIGQENLWTDRSLQKNPMTTYGNYVVIDHGNKEFSMLAHLRAGSVNVRKGDIVPAGKILGEVGNSGASIMPHLHYELRSGDGVAGVRTMPAYFTKVSVLGTGEGKRNARVALDTGDIVMAR